MRLFWGHITLVSFAPNDFHELFILRSYECVQLRTAIGYRMVYTQGNLFFNYCIFIGGKGYEAEGRTDQTDQGCREFACFKN